MEEYYPIKWVNDFTAKMKTKEVDLTCVILNNGKSIQLTGTASLEHHLIEYSVILLKEMYKIKFGGKN